MSLGGRTLIVGGLLLLAGMLSWRAITRNRELLELAEVGSQLEERRAHLQALAADPDGYRAELEKLKAELEIARRETTPDLEALAKQLEARGVKLTAGPPTAERRPFHLAAPTSSLATALADVEGAGHQIDAFRIEVHERGWTADLVAHSYAVTPPPAPSFSVPEQAWYGFINAEERERVRGMIRDVEELERTVGDYDPTKSELELRLRRIEELKRDRIDLIGLGNILFSSGDPPFFTGRLERSETGPRGGLLGRLARPMEDPAIVALFGSKLEARIVRRYAETVEIAFENR